MIDLKINKEFHNLIPPLSEKEYKLLEESITNEGCREVIVVWNDIILDGHNRYEICQKHNIGFKVLEKEFGNEEEAKIWIIHNQLARRNLPPHERIRLALLLKPAIEEKAEKRKKSGKPNLGQKSVEGRTDEEIAKLAGVSRDTVRKSEAIEKEATPEVKEAVRKGKMSVNQAYKKTRKKSAPRIKRSGKEPESLFQLKKIWKTASLTVRNSFLEWVKKGENNE